MRWVNPAARAVARLGVDEGVRVAVLVGKLDGGGELVHNLELSVVREERQCVECGTTCSASVGKSVYCEHGESS